MPRTIEHIMETHRLASERRKAGKPIWDRRVNIKPVLKEDPDNRSDEHAAAVGKRIAKLLRMGLPKAWLDIESDDYDDELDEIVGHLEDVGPSDYGSGCDDLNSALDQLYDWANYKRVWLS